MARAFIAGAAAYKDREENKMSNPKWLQIALGELGTSEVRGGENPRIIEYHAHTSLKASEDEVPWCSSFANYCIDKSGLNGTKQALARSWLKWGEKIEDYRRGAVIIFQRGNSQTLGHVAFVLRDLGDRVEVIGGNQGDCVSIASFPKNVVLGIRWPSTQPRSENS